MDIRNFFPVKNGNSNQKLRSNKDTIKKGKTKSVATKPPSKNTRKRALVFSDSDSDEEPLPKSKSFKRKPFADDDDSIVVIEVKKPRQTESKSEPSVSNGKANSDTKIPKPPAKEIELKSIEVSKYFGKTPVDRSTKHLVEKKPKIETVEVNFDLVDDEFKIDDDEEFEKTLALLDMPGSSSNSNFIESTHSSQEIQTIEKSNIKNSPKKKENKIDSVQKLDIKEVKSKTLTITSTKTDTLRDSENEIVKEKDSSDLNSSNLKTPENKRRENFMNYQRFLHRDGPTALGSKEIPEGADGCLEGKTFVVTGVLESIERDETKTLIEKYKGKVTSTLSKNTSYIVVGRDAGPAKLEKAEKLKTKQLNEDELFDLIKNSPASKHSKKVPEKYSNEKLKTSKVQTDSSELEDSLKENYSNFNQPKVKAKNVLTSISVQVKDEKPSVSVSKPSKVVDSLMWVDKHKPQMLKQVIGQQGDRSNAKKLLEWLKNWHKNRNVPKKAPSRWGGSDDGSSFRASLLSGSPGIGKTTTAQLVCKELGFSFFELNASDTRSKRTLHEEISQLLHNTTITGLIGEKALNSNKHVIIMDEVDGMSGNEDRGGTQELISLIKTSKIPIICICNDRAHPKIRSLSNYCFDLRFQKPRLEQIKSSVLSICCKEGIKIPSDILNEIIVSSCQDVRQVLHNVFLWSAKSDVNINGSNKKKGPTKDIKMGPFDVLKKVFASEEENSNIHEKASLFFHDYSLSPLFVQENYIQVQPKKAKGNKLEHLKLLSAAADSIRDGDMINTVIRSSNNWSLLPTQAIFSSVIPGDTMRGYLNQMIAFPSWLGKNSTKNHMDRVLQQLQMHMRLRISGNKTELNTQYIPLLHHQLTNPLVIKEADGVKEVIDKMEHYYLLREDLESVSELALWSGRADPMSKVNPKVKASLTRTFNKEGFLIPYSINVIKKGKKASDNEIDGEEEESVLSEAELSDDDISKDAMVKQKKVTKAKKATDDNPSTSKGKGRGKSSQNAQNKRGKK